MSTVTIKIAKCDVDTHSPNMTVTSLKNEAPF